MCDPITLAVGALGLVGGATAAGGQKAPAAVLPAADTMDAKSETGAEIVLGGERDEDQLETDIDEDDALKKTVSGSGFTTSAKSSGINIL